MLLSIIAFVNAIQLSTCVDVVLLHTAFNIAISLPQPAITMRIFVVDDEAFARETVKDHLVKKFPDADVQTYETGEDALKNLYRKPDLVVLDYYLDLNDPTAENGAEILKKIRSIMPKLPVVLFSGQDNPAVAADTVRHGAYDYIVKNDSAHHRLELIVSRIYGYGDIDTKLRTQKTMNKILLVIFIIFVMVALYIRFAY